jgi:hypothetical protein
MGMDRPFSPGSQGQGQFNQATRFFIYWPGGVNGGTELVVGLPDVGIFFLKLHVRFG